MTTTTKPVGFALRLMPDYKALLETLADRLGGWNVVIDPTEAEERHNESDVFTMPDSLNQLILHLSRLGLMRLIDPIATEAERVRGELDDLNPALARIAAHPEEAIVRGRTRQSVLEQAAATGDSVERFRVAVAAIERYLESTD